MKTIDGKATSLLEVLKQAEQEDVLVRDAKGQEFVVFAVDDFEEEIIRTRKNAKLMALLDERGKEEATIPLAEVRRQLGL